MCGRRKFKNCRDRYGLYYFRARFVIWYVVSFLTFVSFDQLRTVNVKFPLKVRRYKLYFLHTMCGNVLFCTFKFLSLFFYPSCFLGGEGVGRGMCIFFGTIRYFILRWFSNFAIFITHLKIDFRGLSRLLGVNSQTETHFIAFQKHMAGRTLLWNERLRFSLNVRLNFAVIQ